MKLRDLKRSASAPAWTGDVPPHVWAQTWGDRPREVVKLGMRTLGISHVEQVSSLAEARARRLHPDASPTSQTWADAYNRHLIALAVGRSLCTAESADVPFWDYPDLVAPDALDPAGARWLFEQLTIETERESALVPDASVGELVGELASEVERIDSLPPAKRNMIARLLDAALDLVRGDA